MSRLGEATLDALPPDVILPSYDRARAGIGIVHLGIGAFHRAHQAVFMDRVLTRDGGDWAICGVSLRRPDVAEQMNPQDGLYTVLSRDAAADTFQVVGSVKQVLCAPQDPGLVLDTLAAPSTRIVTLTVTEKGYCHDPATGRLRLDHPDIAHDLANPKAPRTAPGFLAAALARRRAAGTPPFTVLCCDNLPTNGRVAGGIVTALAQAQDQALGDWIAAEVPFPCTMVDRIVPAITERECTLVNEALGVEDRAAVVTEPFIQWVVEDRFAHGRPDLAAAGVEVVGDVVPYETMKIRLLNGSHSTLAYLGFLAGHAHIRDAMRDPAFVALLRLLMDRTVTPTLDVPAGYDVADYKETLLQRFANPTLAHTTYQIAMDGSQKLPQRFLETLQVCLERDIDFAPLSLALAGWMRYVMGTDEEGEAIAVQDPMAERLRAVGQAGGGAGALVRAYLDIREIFPLPIAGSERVAGEIAAHLDTLLNRGAQATVEAFVAARQ